MKKFTRGTSPAILALVEKLKERAFRNSKYSGFLARWRALIFRRGGGSSQRFLWLRLFWEPVRSRGRTYNKICSLPSFRRTFEAWTGVSKRRKSVGTHSFQRIYKFCCHVRPVGIEPTTLSLKGTCSTNWAMGGKRRRVPVLYHIDEEY